ncbi:MAG: hypothetical protein AAF740_11200, partial [Bacteroidota bacterium]
MPKRNFRLILPNPTSPLQTENHYFERFEGFRVAIYELLSTETAFQQLRQQPFSLERRDAEAKIYEVEEDWKGL